jgi:serine/threonine protein kinase
VVLKFPVSSEQSTDNHAFLDRFGTEIRSLVVLSHPHIVKIIDVGEFQDLPFVVMQYLAGGSLKDRIAKGPRGELEPMTLDSLRDWLPDVARALDFIHSQNHVHRDVKPANILFDRHGNAFLGDFGIIKALTSEATDWKNSSLTAPGLLVGTPNYVAPEIVMGRPGRSILAGHDGLRDPDRKQLHGRADAIGHGSQSDNGRPTPVDRHSPRVSKANLGCDLAGTCKESV